MIYDSHINNAIVVWYKLSRYNKLYIMKSANSCDFCLIMEPTKIKNTLMYILPKCVISILSESNTLLSQFTLTYSL